MATLIPPSNESIKREPIPAGLSLAVCYQMIDLGTTYNEKFQNQQHKIMVTFELPEHEVEITQDGVTKKMPRALSKEFTFSLSEKANLRAFLEQWRGKKFTEDEVKKFDVANLVGAPAYLNIGVDVKPDGKTYNSILSISMPPKGVPKPKQINPSQVFSLAEFDQSLFDGFPKFIKEKIEKSDEYKKIKTASVTVEAAVHATEDGDDELPF